MKLRGFQESGGRITLNQIVNILAEDVADNSLKPIETWINANLDLLCLQYSIESEYTLRSAIEIGESVNREYDLAINKLTTSLNATFRHSVDITPRRIVARTTNTGDTYSFISFLIKFCLIIFFLYCGVSFTEWAYVTTESKLGGFIALMCSAFAGLLSISVCGTLVFITAAAGYKKNPLD